MRIVLPLVGPTYADQTRSFAREECINWFPEISGTSGSRTRYLLRTHAGLALFSVAVAGLIRGMREMGGLLYVVAGETLYRIAEDGTSASLGTILGGARCVLTDNFIPDTKRQLVIFTGERTYVYDTLLGLSEVTDPDYIAVARQDTGTFLDGYVIAATQDGFIYSAVTDATVWNALDFQTAEAATDMTLAVWSVYGDVWVFGGRTTEIFRNTGDADNQFQRVQTIEKGIGAKYSPANLDNAVFWIDDSGRVYRASGFNPVRVSTHAVEQYLSTVDYSGAFGFTYVDRGHEFYCFTVPGGRTYLYDVATQLWHRRASQDLGFWRVSAYAKCYGRDFFGDYNTSNVWELDQSAVSEGPYRLVRERISGYVHEKGAPVFTPTIEIIADTGTAPQDFSGDPQIELRYSDDRGNNWSNFRGRSIGRIGQYAKRIRWHRTRMTRQRAYHLRISDPVRCDVLEAVMDASAGDLP